MRKLFLLLVIAGSFPLRATFTRSFGLGLDPDTAWMIRDQLPYLFKNPAYAADYRNLIYFESILVSGTPAERGGIFVPFFGDTTLGVFSGTAVNDAAFNSNAFSSLFHSDASYDAQTDFASILNNPARGINTADMANPALNPLTFRNLETLLAYKIGRFDAGTSLSFAYASTKRRYEDTAANETDQLTLYKGEFTLTQGIAGDLAWGPLRAFDAALIVRKYSVDNKYQGRRGGTNGNAGLQSGYGTSDILLNVRGAAVWNQRNTFFLQTAYGYLNRSVEAFADMNFGTAQDATDKYDRTGHRLEAGVSHEITVNARVMVFYGTHLVYQTFSNSYDGRDRLNAAAPFPQNPYAVREFSIRAPLLIGISARMSESSSFRFGVRHNAINSGNNTVIDSQNRGSLPSADITSRERTVESTYLNASTVFSTGFSYSFENLTFDWLGNVAIFRQGPYVLSGASNDLSTAFSVSYNFEEAFKSEPAPRTPIRRRRGK